MGLARRLEQRAISYQDFWGKDYESSVNIDATGLMYYGNRTFAGINVTQERALRLSAVWACVSLIADAIAAMPMESHRIDGAITKQITTPDWLQKPSTEISVFDFKHRVVTSLLLDGNAYCLVLRSGNRVTELIPIHPSRVWPQRNPQTHRIEYKIDHDWVANSDEILHIPAFTKPGDLRGMSPIEASKEAIALGLATEEYGSRFFGQGATMSGVIGVPGKLDAEGAEVIRRTFQQEHQGNRKAHLPGVLTGGATWTPISVPPDDAQFLETRRFQVEEVARIYRVPLHLIQHLDTSTSWGTGIEEQNAGFATHTLRPWIARLEIALSDLMPGPQTVKFNMDDLLRAKTLDRFNAYAIALSNGFFNKDEVRQKEDMPPLPDGAGAVHLQPLNMGPAGKPDKPEPKPDPTPVLIKDPAGYDAGDPNDPKANGANP
jgi:HK97 family phage portal protein